MSGDVTRLAAIAVVITGFASPAGSDALALDLAMLTRASEEGEQAVRTADIRYTDHWESFEPPPEIPADLALQSPHLAYELEANRTRDTERHLWWDAATGQWRVDAVDQRDLSRLAPAGAVRDRISLTQSMLFGKKDYFVTVAPATATAAVHAIPQRQRPSGPPLQPGVVPSRILKVKADVGFRGGELDGRKVAIVEIKGADFGATFYVDPDIGYRYLKVVYRTPDGKVYKEERASGYRKTDGVPYPRRYEERIWNKAGALARREEIIVEAARFNAPLDPATFQLAIPAGTVVSVLAGDERGARQTQEPMTLDLDNALDALDTISRQRPAVPQAGAGATPPTGPPGPLTPPTRRSGDVRIELPGTRPASQPSTQPTTQRARP